MSESLDDSRRAVHTFWAGMAVIAIFYPFVAYGVLTGTVSLLNDRPSSKALALTVPLVVMAAGPVGWRRGKDPQDKAAEGVMTMAKVCIWMLPVFLAWVVVGAVMGV